MDRMASSATSELGSLGAFFLSKMPGLMNANCFSCSTSSQAFPKLTHWVAEKGNVVPWGTNGPDCRGCLI